MSDVQQILATAAQHWGGHEALVAILMVPASLLILLVPFAWDRVTYWRCFWSAVRLAGHSAGSAERREQFVWLGRNARLLPRRLKDKLLSRFPVVAEAIRWYKAQNFRIFDF